MGTGFLADEKMTRDLSHRDGGACSWRLGGQDLLEGSGALHVALNLGGQATAGGALQLPFPSL